MENPAGARHQICVLKLKAAAEERPVPVYEFKIFGAFKNHLTDLKTIKKCPPLLAFPAFSSINSGRENGAQSLVRH
jgi:hypothetical protein